MTDLMMDMKDYLDKNFAREEFISGKSPIRLQEVPFDVEEVEEAMESLLSTFLVMGKKTKKFEAAWSAWLGRRHSIFVNSGTSAVLLAMMWVKFKRAIKGDRNEILIPAVTWSTSLFPAMIVGLKPILVDVELSNLCVNSFKPYITDKTVAVMPVHLMGHACDMPTIVEEAKQYDLTVIEDCCEAHGTKIDGKKIGTFGDISVWSFMFAHHITTVEGGMLSVDDGDLADVFRMFRAHGWVREVSEDTKKKIVKENPNIHQNFLFPEIGLNVRPTEINAAFGIHQMKRLDGFIEKRRYAFKRITDELKPYADYLRLFPERDGEFYSPFAYPIVVQEQAPFSRAELYAHLDECQIHYRPIEGSNLAMQPFMKQYANLVETRGSLKNADIIHDQGFFIGLNQDTNDERIEYIVKSFKEFLRKF